MDLYHRNTAVHSPNLTLSVPPVQSLLNDYYQALTHVCSTGLQLAGRLDKELASNRNSSDNHNGNIQADSNCSSDLRRNIKQLTHVYSDIISKMKPLWEQIQMECTADNERSTLNHHGKQTSARLNEMCSCIIEFHRSALESGASLLSKPASTKDSKISLSRKNSPCIVITDTDNLCGSSRCCPQRTTHSNLGPQRSLSKHLAKAQPPTDADMDNIINFLSFTREATPKQRSASPVANKRFPLSNQRSSPLPGTSVIAGHEHIVPDLAGPRLTRPHSDWQLYDKAASTSQMDKPNSPWTSHNGSAGDMYETQGAHSVQHQQLPFSNWSTGLNKEQSIWSQGSAANSGDESSGKHLHSHSQSVLNTSERPSSSLYRKPSDSSDGSQTFDTALGTSTSTPQPPFVNQSLLNPPLFPPSASSNSSITNNVWSNAVAQCWSNSPSSEIPSLSQGYEYDLIRPTPAPSIGNQNSIWKPIADLPLNPAASHSTASLMSQIPGSSTAAFAPYTSHSKIKPSHSNLF